MATISAKRIASARKAANDANRLGDLIYGIAQAFFVLLTMAMIVGMFAAYVLSKSDEEGYDTVTNWNAVLPMWGVIIGVWMIYSCGLALIALAGAIARAKAESLEIQIVHAQD
jgi:ABC-type multidrug transport system permease subunit